MIGFAVLTAYKAGTYTPGMENDIQVDDKKNAEDFIQSLLANYNQVQGIKAKEEPQLTFAEVYRKFNVKKFGHEYDAKKVKRTAWNIRYAQDSRTLLPYTTEFSQSLLQTICRK